MAKKHCPKTCGACTGVQQVNVELDDVVSGGAACADSDKKDKNYCPERQSRCASSNFIQRTCPKTCGLCGKVSSAATGTIAPTPPTASPTHSPVHESDEGA